MSDESEIQIPDGMKVVPVMGINLVVPIEATAEMVSEFVEVLVEAGAIIYDAETQTLKAPPGMVGKFGGAKVSFDDDGDRTVESIPEEELVADLGLEGCEKPTLDQVVKAFRDREGLVGEEEIGDAFEHRKDRTLN